MFELSKEICQLIESKGKNSTVLQDKEWKSELAFLADVAAHLNFLNLRLQGRNRMITGKYDAVKALQVKLLLRETQVNQCNLPHFPCCQTMSSQVDANMFPNMCLADTLITLRPEFTRRFRDFESQTENFELFRNPFAADVETFPVELQMKLIELQCNGSLKAKYDALELMQLIRSIPETMPQLRLHIARTLCMFGSTYLCEKLFLLMKINKPTSLI